MRRINITELDHIVLNVSDIERSLKFLHRSDGLKARASRRIPKQARLGFPPYASMPTR